MDQIPLIRGGYSVLCHAHPEREALVYKLGFHPEVPLMIRSNLIEDQLVDLGCQALDSMFRRRIEEGANCSPFVPRRSWRPSRISCCRPRGLGPSAGLGQFRLLVIAAEEPAGKALAECQKVSALLTLDAGQEDYQVRLAHGVEGLRRRRSFVLPRRLESKADCSATRTSPSACSIAGSARSCVTSKSSPPRNRGPDSRPTAGIGPGQTHRVQAVRLYLKGLEANEIARCIIRSVL